MAELKQRTTRRFSWAEVPAEVTRTLLVAVYRAGGEAAEVDKLEKLDDLQLADQAEKTLKPGISARHFDTCVPVLRQLWLPLQPLDDLIHFAGMVGLELTGAERAARLDTRRAVLEFLARKRATATFKANLHAFFKRQSKIRVLVESRGGTFDDRLSQAVELRGRGAPDPRRPFPHQQQAWQRLDQLTKAPAPRTGLLVLPTGAGKTYTMVAWLTALLGRDPGRRVLWIADQQELIEQAARTFHDQAPTMAAGQDRRLRVIHGGASPIDLLTDPTVHVVCTTRQSLIGRGFHDGARKRLAGFLQRPTVVVVDEAHHAVSPTYRELLDFITATAPEAMLVGLTATPWPSGYGMTALLRERFATPVADVQVRDLVRDGVLATPVLHAVDSGELIEVRPEEVREIAGRDIPPEILRRLDRSHRNELIVQAWLANSQTWGKTLVFAVDIEHAEHLTATFRAAGVEARVVHSAADKPRAEVLADFRAASGPTVLVSVGMLLQGVDMPDARTAFLARPTTSPIVMRQMVGRVLRGPAAGGDPVAHVVDIRDRWGADIDLFEPPEIRAGEVFKGAEDPAYHLPPVLDEASGEPIGEDVIRRIERAYGELRAAALPHGLALETTALVGFFELDQRNVPVFEHCLDRWRELIAATIAGTKLPVRSSIDLFDDLPVPRPTLGDVRAVVSFCRAQLLEPPLVPVRAALSPRAVARQLLDGPASTVREQQAMLRQTWESTLARSAFSSFQAFYEAVQHELLSLGGLAGAVTDPEAPAVVSVARALPALETDPSRELAPIFDAAVARGRDLVAGEPAEYRDLLANAYLPRYSWTRGPIKWAWAYWTPRISGRGRGNPIIRVNRVLQAPARQVSDDVLSRLLWHELCHHLLPGRGHDSEFRRLEALWPNSELLAGELQGLPERFDLGWTAPHTTGPGAEPAPEPVGAARGGTA